MANRKKSLAQDLADLFNPAPTNEYDPDALDLADDAKLSLDDEHGEARAEPSKRAPEKAMLLRGDIVLGDAAYRGRRTSRAAIFGEDTGAEDADDDGDSELDLRDDNDENLSSDGEDGDVSNDDDEGGDDDDGDGERRAAACSAGPSGRSGAKAKAATAEAAAGSKSAVAKRAMQFANGGLDSSDGAEQENDDEDKEGEEEEGSDLGDGMEDGLEDGDEDEDDDLEEEEQPGAKGHVQDRARAAGRQGRASGKGGSGGRVGDALEALEAEYEAMQQENEKQLEALREKGERDRMKGAAVRNQQVLYERALEQRILLQKCLQASNGLPRPETYAALVVAAPDVREGYAQLGAAARDTLSQLLELQHALMSRNPAITLTPSPDDDAASGRAAKRRRADAGGDNDADGDLESLWRWVSSRHEALVPFRDTSLDSWHRRTVLSSGSGALRNSGFRALNQSISSQVQALMRDPVKFIKRTRLSLSVCPRVLCEPPRSGAPTATLDRLGADAEAAVVGLTVGPSASVAADLTEEERDPETYDDSEFYQQLLKEFLDKGLAQGATAAPKDAKKRKLVDRRASKGRKLRYHVQEKLVAFMAPVDFTPPPFAANLFSNLFGHAGK